jgi:hypothetical protein
MHGWRFLWRRHVQGGALVIPKDLEKPCRYKVFKMLARKGKITQESVKLIMSWRQAGFNVHCSPRIQPGNEEAMENLARLLSEHHSARKE